VTISFNLVTVADSISKLSIAGVNVRDLDQIPESAMNNLPVLYPIPNGYITGINWQRLTFGDSEALMDTDYLLHYRYLHAVVGSGGGLLSVYAGMVFNIVAILKTIFANSTITGAVDLTLDSISDIGALTDPAGQTLYHGVDITLKVLEFTQ
jgi:hypothetical protein